MRKLICRILRHKWSEDWRAIDLESVAFRRVDCLRCGLAIDGVTLKQISRERPWLTRNL